MSSRRKFLQNLSSTALLVGSGSISKLMAEENYEQRIIPWEKKITANDKIRIAVIGTGIQGHSDLGAALKVPGVELVAACDLYTGRLERMKELYGKDLFTTKDYREILEKKDIDAVLVVVPDLWHSRICIDALNKGKHVYCEKPMVHKLSQGNEVINAWKRSGKIMQVGSQGISGASFAKAKELYQAGEIGQLNCIEATYDRQSAIGAWQYTIPTDDSPQTVDWDRYVSLMTVKPKYDEKKFFWWRNYKDFGTGMSGDLFVHLITGIHHITNSKGPTRIYSAGQLAYWKDGRDVPDVMVAIMEYPATKEHAAFQTMLRVNFISGGGDRSAVRYIGSEGVMEKTGNGVRLNYSIMPKAPGIGGWDSLSTYPQAMQDELKKRYDEKWTADDKKRGTKQAVQYNAPPDSNDHVEHFANFFEGVRTGKQVIEDPIVGFRAAAPCLAANDSYFQKKIINWDPEKMRLASI
jgi:predicted dehydrogenase